MTFLDAIAVSLWIAWWIYFALFMSWCVPWAGRLNHLIDELEDKRKATIQRRRLNELNEWHARLDTIGETR